MGRLNLKHTSGTQNQQLPSGSVMRMRQPQCAAQTANELLGRDTIHPKSAWSAKNRSESAAGGLMRYGYIAE